MDLPGDFPSDTVVRTPPPNAGDAGSTPGREAKIPHASQPKKTETQNQSNILIKSIKTSKMAHIKKHLLKKINSFYLEKIPASVN